MPWNTEKYSRRSTTPHLWSKLMFVTFWLSFLLLEGSCGRLHTHRSWKQTLPDNLTEYQTYDNSSSCACRVTCIIDESCSAVSVKEIDGHWICSYSYVNVSVEDLLWDKASVTWLFGAVNKTENETETGISNATATTGNVTTIEVSATSNSTSSDASTNTDSVISTTTVLPTGVSSTTTQKAVDCGNWKEFRGSCYKHFRSELGWLLARGMCVFYKSQLVTITSVEEFDFVKGVLLGDSWIGLNDLNSAGIYRWSSDSSIYNSYEKDSSWWSQDDLQNTEKGLCVSFQKNSKTWTKIDCDTTLKFVCETTPKSGH
ncbi:CD209 antigen-like protein 2 [Palaemon carinicauda]|uniref:CD209 antigen-like protein 2 n=1 Tax=Palaemon carinicauda TaxID=392227 RepID=UPI0035B5E032